MEERIYEEWNGFNGEEWKNSIDVSAFIEINPQNLS